LYHSGRASHFAEGSWGIFRVFDELQGDLKPLPSREQIQKSAPSVCPADAPVKTFNVSAVDQALRYHDGAPGGMKSIWNARWCSAMNRARCTCSTGIGDGSRRVS